MAEQYRIVYCLNQFFGGLGGEDKAYQPPLLINGARGPGLLLERLSPDLQVTATLIVGDNYVAENQEKALQDICRLLAPLLSGRGEDEIDLLFAGPAFNAGRYGLSCGAVCRHVATHFALPALTGMHPENPAVEIYRKDVLIAETGKDVMVMQEAVQRMAGLALKLLRGEELLPERDGYIPHGQRQNYFAERRGAERAVDMLLLKIAGSDFATEYPMPVFDRVDPALPVKDLHSARLALVTSGGIVPRGNPDRIEAASASRFGVYSLEGITALDSTTHQTAHGGYDPTFANQDPNRVLPLDAVRELEAEGVFGSLHPFYYATVGNGTSVARATNFGQEIGKRLLADGVQAVILTST